MSSTDKKAFGSVSFYRCPSRRGGNAYADETANTSNPGPQTDYAVLAGYNGTGDSTSPDQRILGNVWKQSRVSFHDGPFRVAQTTVSGNRIVSWEPRDTFAWWSDGTSNQLIVSEKHIPRFSLGKCNATSSNANDPAETRLFDCSYLAASSKNGNSPTAAPWFALAFVVTPRASNTADAYKGRRIARGDTTDLPPLGNSDERWTFSHTNPLLGSAHPGSINVLLGDGSVRGCPKNADSEVICRLTAVGDGKSVSLP